MGISAGMETIAEVRVIGLSGTRGLGMHRLQFAFLIDIQATPGREVHVDTLRCAVSATPVPSQPAVPLGTAILETSWHTRTADYARHEGLSAYLDLSSTQLEALEELRAGGALHFRLDIAALVRSAERGVERGFQQLWHEVNLASWLRVLEDLGSFDALLLCVELPEIDQHAPLSSAVSEIRQAHRDLLAGRYDAAVGRARLVIDLIDRTVGTDQQRTELIKAFGTNRESRAQMSKRARADFVRLAVRHYTHLAHHIDDSGVVGSFGRHEALFVLTAAAATLWDALGTALLTAAGARDETPV